MTIDKRKEDRRQNKKQTQTTHHGQEIRREAQANAQDIKATIEPDSGDKQDLRW